VGPALSVEEGGVSVGFALRTFIGGGACGVWVRAGNERTSVWFCFDKKGIRVSAVVQANQLFKQPSSAPTFSSLSSWLLISTTIVGGRRIQVLASGPLT
jgi:hypothetical protein